MKNKIIKGLVAAIGCLMLMLAISTTTLSHNSLNNNTKNSIVHPLQDAPNS